MTTRTLHIAGQALTYQIKRSARRSIGLKITSEGLTLTIPTRFPLADADRAVIQKIDWIRAKLAQVHAQPKPAAQLEDGASVLWLGESKTLVLGCGRSKIVEDEIHLAATGDETQITRALQRFYQREARNYFADCVEHWSAKMGLQPRQLALSSARGRWGSCSASGGIRLNWRLMQAPLEVVDYVVIHELAHLAELNHSARFWAIVAAHCPNWKQQRQWLRLHGQQLMGW